MNSTFGILIGYLGEYKILGEEVFPVNVVMMLAHGLLASRVSTEKTALSAIVATLKEKFLTFCSYFLVFPFNRFLEV